MKRCLVVLLGLALAGVAEAQPAAKVWRIGAVMSLYATQSEQAQALRKQLQGLGYVEGRNLVIEWRYAQGRDERLPDLATELVRARVDLIVADSTVAGLAAHRATTTIPIVVASADPVGGGLVANLSRPGGNVTGLSVMHADTSVKRLELLKEAVPTISRVAVLWNPATPFHRGMLKEIDAAAPTLKLRALPIAVKGRDDLGDAFAEIRKARADAVYVGVSMAPATREELVAFAGKHRLPTVFQSRNLVAAGGLMSYAPNSVDTFRQVAGYVDKILKGAKPGDLPVAQSTKFELVINLRTAKELGLTIPPAVLARADELIK